MAADFDSVVIGAGVIGLAVAGERSCSGQQVIVIEKTSRAVTETSSRNSEVIHAGIYYPKNSLKTRLCIEGRELLYAYCATHGVVAKRLGKLIVATTVQDEAKLKSIQAVAADNGVNDLQLLSKAEVAKLDPEIFCTSALFSPSTGVVDVTALMLTLQGEAEGLGAIFTFNTKLTAARKHGDIFILTTTDISGEMTEITSRHFINCAGHGALEVALAIEGIDAGKLPRQFLAKGSYCSLSGKSPFSHLIYPVPVSGALGIHATLDQAGFVRFGPDIEWVDALDYSLPLDIAKKFSASIKTYWPGVANRALTPSYYGIRPKLHGLQSGFADFYIQGVSEHGTSGLVNLFGIESPGLTASLAIAKQVVNCQNKRVTYELE